MNRVQQLEGELGSMLAASLLLGLVAVMGFTAQMTRAMANQTLDSGNPATVMTESLPQVVGQPLLSYGAEVLSYVC